MNIRVKQQSENTFVAYTYLAEDERISYQTSSLLEAIGGLVFNNQQAFGVESVTPLNVNVKQVKLEDCPLELPW